MAYVRTALDACQSGRFIAEYAFGLYAKSKLVGPNRFYVGSYSREALCEPSVFAQNFLELRVVVSNDALSGSGLTTAKPYFGC